MDLVILPAFHYGAASHAVEPPEGNGSVHVDAGKLAPFAEELGLTVRVFGTPAEESGTGKEIMLNRGVFAGTHAAMMVHPSLKDVVAPRFRASRSWRVTYTGRGGHAALHP